MKKREKPPEVEAFERAFDQGAGTGGEASVSWPAPGQSAIRRSVSAPPGLHAQSRPSSGLASRLPGVAAPTAQSQRLAVTPASVRTAARPLGRAAALGRQAWESDEAEEYEDASDESGEDQEAAFDAAEQTRRARQDAGLASAGPDRFSAVLVRMVLALVALVAAYSLQSHSQRHYTLGPMNGSSISSVGYDAGWPLTYAHVELQQVPISNSNPSPSLHIVQPIPLAVDMFVLAVPLWLLLEAVWLFWTLVLHHFGPKKFLRRCIAIGFTAVPASLWLLGALALGAFLSVSRVPRGTPAIWPKYIWPALFPAVPGFGLASALSSLLSIPPNLWRLDVGIFLLVVAVPLLLLTACLYSCFCLIGRGLRQLSGRQ